MIEKNFAEGFLLSCGKPSARAHYHYAGTKKPNNLCGPKGSGFGLPLEGDFLIEIVSDCVSYLNDLVRKRRKALRTRFSVLEQIFSGASISAVNLIQISWSPECRISRLLEGVVNLFNRDPLRIKGEVHIAFKCQQVDFDCVAKLLQGIPYLDSCLLSPTTWNHELDPFPSLGRQLTACASE